MMCRMIIFELVQALKFKTTIPDENFLMLISFVLQGIYYCGIYSCRKKTY